MGIRKANTKDAKPVQELINKYARRHKLIPRSLNDLYEKIRDVSVYEDDKKRLIGTCSLHVSWEDLAEIRSLAVEKRHQHKGVGKALVKNAIREAKKLGIRRVFVLTYVPQFFARFGFETVDKNTLPNKIWADCLSCPRFPDCDETAVVLDLEK